MDLHGTCFMVERPRRRSAGPRANAAMKLGSRGRSFEAGDHDARTGTAAHKRDADCPFTKDGVPRCSARARARAWARRRRGEVSNTPRSASRAPPPRRADLPRNDRVYDVANGAGAALHSGGVADLCRDE